MKGSLNGVGETARKPAELEWHKSGDGGKR